jgi:hypothetical protein
VRFDFDIKTARNLLIFGSASFILAGLLTQWCIEYTDLTCTEGNELVDLSKGYKNMYLQKIKVIAIGFIALIWFNKNSKDKFSLFIILLITFVGILDLANNIYWILRLYFS